ncbi:MAG: 3-deoxy-D-manno-octulosonic acid transferase [Desulfobacterales bacterium]|jgi:3-deoxy-D-manno-octulosonic-acid transferase
MIRVYNIAVAATLMLALPFLLPYIILSAKRRRVLLRRLGLVRPSIVFRSGPPTGKPIWVHALSVGEVFAGVPLVHALASRYAHRPIVFSASTIGGYEMARQKLGDTAAAVFFFPYDLPLAVKRMAAWITPGVVIIIETDIWPNFLSEMQRREVPVILVNAKLSNRSFAGYRRVAAFSTSLFAMLTKICCQTREDAARFRRLGVTEDRIEITGNIKFDQSEDPLETKEIASLRAALNSEPLRPVWVAGSTHNGEEEIIRQAFTMVKKEHQHPDLLLILAPRDPSRAEAVGRLFNTAGFGTVAMSALSGSNPMQRIEVVVIDVLGILKNLYALADVALVGGSLLQIRGIGGHNPLEPAAFGKPVQFGPNMKNFKEIERLLIEAGGAVQVTDARSIANSLRELLMNHELANRMGRNAHAVFKANKGAVKYTLKAVAALIDPPKTALDPVHR